MPSRRSVPGVLPDSCESEGDVQHIVRELEGDAQPLPVLRQHVHDRLVGARHHRAEPARHGDQRAGLAAEHVEVVVDRVASVARPRRLQDLPGDEPLERLGLGTDRLGPEVGQGVGDARAKRKSPASTATELPQRVFARHAAPRVGLVHHVVVVQGGEMSQFDDHGRGHDTRRVGVTELRGEHHEQRTEPLPAGAQQVLRGLCDEGDLALGDFEQALLHSRQSGLDIGFESLVRTLSPNGPTTVTRGSPVC